MTMMTRTAGALAFAGAAATLLSACGGSAEAEGHQVQSAQADSAAFAYADGVYDGPRVTNLRGGYQAQVTVTGGRITGVAAIEAGTNAPESVAINARAVPELADKVIAAQSAQVEHVSGSSYTSPAFLESIQGALDAAGGAS